MKIGVDIRCLMERQYSGISEYTYNLLDHLFRLNQRHQYVLFYNSARVSHVPLFRYPHVTVREFQYPNKLFNLSMRFLRRPALDRLIGGVDLFLTPNFLFSQLSNRCRRLLIVHDLSFVLYPEFFTLKKRLWHFLINARRLSQAADRIIAISGNTKADLVTHYRIAPEKISVVYPGVDQQYFQPVATPEREAVRRRYQLPSRFILYLGNLEPRKNIASLIEAFGKVNQPDLGLAIAGGAAWKYQQLYRLARQSAARSHIHFLGYVAAADKPALYQLARAFVYPSIYEGFGLPPIEAMASGTPVITSHSASLPETVGEAAVLVDPHNVADLTAAIGQVTGDEDLRRQLIDRGQQRSRQFHWPTVAQAVQTIIDSFDR